MLAHDFEYQLLRYVKSQFVEGFERDFYDPFRIFLRNFHDSAALQMFAKQHAERQRDRGILWVLLDKMQPGVGASHGGEQLYVTGFGVYMKNKLIIFRLINFFYFA